jgi:hypothetical protein
MPATAFDFHSKNTSGLSTSDGLARSRVGEKISLTVSAHQPTIIMFLPALRRYFFMGYRDDAHVFLSGG